MSVFTKPQRIAELARRSPQMGFTSLAYLSQKVRSHYAYYGITGKARALQWFLFAVHRAWRKWLNRRNRQREMLWDRFNRLLRQYRLPPPRIIHSYVT